MNSEQKILDLKDKVKKLEEIKIRVEEKQKYLQTEKDRLITELQGYGIDPVVPENVTSYLTSLDSEIQGLITAIETNIPVIPKELIENA